MAAFSFDRRFEEEGFTIGRQAIFLSYTRLFVRTLQQTRSGCVFLAHLA